MPRRVCLFVPLLALALIMTACGGSQTVAEGVTTQPTAPPVEPTTPSPASPIPSTPSPTVASTLTPTVAVTPTPSPVQTSTTTDLTALSPEVAPPTPEAGADDVVLSSQPIRMIIPAIGAELNIVAVGTDEQNIPIVPKHDVGWFDRSARPGQNSNVVFWAHVLRWLDSPDIPAPFARVEELTLGAEIVVVTEDGGERRYRVSEQVRVLPEDITLLYPTASERITLVSCIGDKVIRDGTLTKEERLVTIATPIE